MFKQIKPAHTELESSLINAPYRTMPWAFRYVININDELSRFRGCALKTLLRVLRMRGSDWKHTFARKTILAKPFESVQLYGFSNFFDCDYDYLKPHADKSCCHIHFQLTMKAVILAAGYGTRLQRDIENDTAGNFKHLAGIAKPLLPVGPCALISHWVQALTKTRCVDIVYVVVSAE